MTRAAPWTHVKTGPRQGGAGRTRMGLEPVCTIFAHLIWPVMPDLAKMIHECIQPVGYEGGVIPFPGRHGRWREALDELTPGQPIKAPEVLVAKISDEQAWNRRSSRWVRCGSRSE